MKKVIFSALLLGITSIGHSQEGKPQVQEVALSAVTVSPIVNSSYRNMAIEGINSKIVIDMEEIAARYDITEAPFFDKNMDAYEVIFKNSKGNILANFNKTGKIISTVERYKDITLPIAVRNTLVTNFPGWELTNNNYLVEFRDGHGIKRVFNIKIRKDRARKNLKLNVQGELIG